MDRLKKSGSEINPASLGDVVAGPGMASLTGVTKSILAQIKGIAQILHGYDCVVGLANTNVSAANTDTLATFSFIGANGLPNRANTLNLENYVADTPRLMPVIAAADRKSLTVNNCDYVDYFRYQGSIVVGNTGATDASVTVTVGVYNDAGTALLEEARTGVVPAGSYREFNFIDGGTSASIQNLKVTIRSNVTNVGIRNTSRINIHCENRGLTYSDVFSD